MEEGGEREAPREGEGIAHSGKEKRKEKREDGFFLFRRGI